MIENGFVYAVDKFSEKLKKIELKKDENTEKLRSLFKKYNVSYADTFSIANWNLTDIRMLAKVTLYPLDFATNNDHPKVKF